MKAFTYKIIFYPIVFIAIVFYSNAFSQTSWNIDNSGSWGLNTNFSPTTVPNAIDAAVNLTYNITAARTVTVTASTTYILGSLTIGDPTTSFFKYTLAGGDASSQLTFDVSSGSAGITMLSSTTSAQDISVKLLLNDDIVITNNSSALLTISGAINTNGKTLTVTGSGNVTLSGVISGSGSIVKSGTGTLTLSSASNSYTGTTTISAGTISASTIVVAAGVSSIGNTVSAVILGDALNTGTLSYTGAVATFTRGFTINAGGGNITNTTTNLLTIGTGTVSSTTGNVTFSCTNTGGITVTSTISGVDVYVNSSSSGSTTFSSTSNAYSGNTTITLGKLKLGAAGVIPDASLVTATGTLDMNTYSETVGGITGGGTITTGAAGSCTLTFGGDNIDRSFTGTITAGSGTLSLTKTGSGTQTLSGANSFSGTLTLSAGKILATTNAGALGAGTLALNSGELILQNATGLSFGRNVTVGASVQITSNVSSAGAGVTHTLGTLSIGAYTLTIAGGSNVTSGTAGVSFGAVTHTAAPIYTVTNPSGGGTTQLSVAAVSNSTFLTTFNGNGNVIQTGVFGNGTGGITYSGTGTLTLSQANTFSGAVSATSGTIKISAAGVAALSGPLGTNGGGTSISSSATLDMNGQTFLTTEAITINGFGTDGYGALKNSSASDASLPAGGTLALGSSSTIGTTASGSLTINSVISASSNTYALSVNCSSTGAVVFAGANTYDGTTTVSAGTLKLGASSTLAASGPLGSSTGGTTVASGATLDLNAFSLTTSATETLTLNGTGVSSTGALLNSTSTACTWAGTIALNTASTIGTSNTNSLSCTGVITGSTLLTIVNSSSGSVILSGNSTAFTGGVTLSTGILKVGHNYALGTGIFSVASGTTLDASAASVSLQSSSHSITGDFTFTGTNSLSLGSGNINLNSANRVITMSHATNTLTSSDNITEGYSLIGSGTGSANIVLPNNTTLVSWTLTSNGNATSTTYTTGSALAKGSSNTGALTYAATGASTNVWNNGSLDANAYFEYTFTPASGYDNTITQIQFTNSTSSGTQNVAVYYSTNGFSSSTQLKANISSLSTTNQTVYMDFSGGSISVPNGTTFKIRVYGWGNSSSAFFYRNLNMEIIGSQANAACALAAGTYSVGSGQTYATIPAAITALNCGISGPVIFSLTDASYAISPQSIGAVVGASATNTITFKPAAGISPTITCTATANDQAAFKLTDSDYIIFDGSNTTNGTTKDMTIVMAGAFYTRVFSLATGTSGATYNTIKNCNLTGYALTSGNYGIYMSGLNNDNNTFYNNYITKEYYGIYMTSGSTANHNDNNTIYNNIIGPTTNTAASYISLGGIYAQYQSTFNIYGNTVQYVISSNASNTYGIYLDNVDATNVYKNLIHDVVYNGSSGYAGMGLRMSTSESTVDLDWNVYNNMIYAIAGDGNSTTSTKRHPCGMFFDEYSGTPLAGRTANSLHVYYNSIYLTPNTSYGLNQLAAMSVGVMFYNWASNSSSGTGYFDFRNNLIRNSLGVKSGNGSSSFSYCVYDAQYNTGVAYRSTGNNDYNIFYNDANVTNIYLAALQGGNSGGTNYTLGQIGSYRTDVGASAFTKNSDPNFSSINDLHILNNTNLNGYQGDNTCGITTDYDGDTRSGTTAIGADEATICSTTFFVGSTYDGLNYFQSFSGSLGLFNKLNTIPLCGNITVDVTANVTEAGTISLDTDLGGYTMLVEPSAASVRTISGTAVSSNSPMIKFNTANNVTIDGRFSGSGNYLLFRNTNATPANTGPTIQFSGGTTGNTIKYCTIENNGTTTTAANPGSGIYIGTGTNNLTIDNNNILGAIGGTTGKMFAGIYSVSTGSNTINVRNNEIYNYVAHGVYGDGIAGACQVTGNKLYLTSSATPSTASKAIYINGSSGHRISNNIIGGQDNTGGTGPYTLITTASNTFTAIHVTAPLTIQGNTIKNITMATSIAAQTSGVGIFTAIYVPSGTTMYIGDTTANIIGDSTNASNSQLNISSTGTTGSWIQGISVTATGTIYIKNNVISNFSGADVASKGYVFYGIKTSSTGSFTISSNTIGNIAAGSSITIGGSSNTGSAVCSYYGINSAATGTIIISSNKIGSATVYGTGAGGVLSGIYNSGGTTTISSNLISKMTKGSVASTSLTYNYMIYNSTLLNATISSNSISTATIYVGDFYGIYDNSAISSSSYSHTISSNTIGTSSSGNISLLQTSVSAVTRNNVGIYVLVDNNTATLGSNGTPIYTVSNNVIRSFTQTNDVAYQANFVGVQMGGSNYASYYIVKSNEIYNLKYTNATTRVINMYGLLLYGGSANSKFTGCVVEKNKIYGYEVAAAHGGGATFATFYGIYASTIRSGGNAYVTNNLIYFNNGSNTNGLKISGMELAQSSATVYVVYNTVFIEGSDNGATGGTNAMYQVAYAIQADNYTYNNIFYNNRTSTCSNVQYALSKGSGVTVTAANWSNNYGWSVNTASYVFVPSSSDITATTWISSYSADKNNSNGTRITAVGTDGSLTSTNLGYVVTTYNTSGITGCTYDINGVTSNRTSGTSGHRGCYEASCISFSSNPSAGNICYGSTYSPSVTVQNSSNASSTFTYTLQFSINNSSFSDFSNGTPSNSSYTNGYTTSSTVASGAIASANSSTVSGNIAVGSAYYYRYKVVSSAGCTDYSSSAQLTVNALPTTAVLAGTASICEGASSNLTVTITGGTSPYSVVYTGNGGGTVNAYTTGSNISQTPALTATYGLTSVTDANGCTATTPSGTPTITVNALPSITGTLSACVGSTTSLTGSGTAAGSTPWTSGTIGVATVPITVTTTGVVTGVSAGTSVITYTDNNGCSNTATVTINALPTLTTAATPVVIGGVNYNAGSQTSTLAYTASTNSPSSYSIDWSSGISDQGSTAHAFAGGGSAISDIAITAGVAAGTYNGTMTYTNVNGCSGTKTVTITISSSATVFYYDGTGSLSSTSNWGTNSDGTGTNPIDLTSGSLTFYVLHNGSNAIPSNDATWTLGSGSKVIVGNGTNTTNFTITSGNTITGTVDVVNNATLTIEDATPPTFGTLNSGSTVVYKGGSSQSIASGTAFGSLTIYNPTGVSLGGNASVSGTLALTDGTLATGANTLTISGSTISRASGNINASNGSALISFTNASALTLPASCFTGSVNKMTLNGAGGVTLGSNTTVASTLTLTNGTLTLGANTLTLANNSAPVRTSGNINATNAAAEVEFTNTSGLTLPASLFSGSVSKWKMNGSGGITLSGNTTISGTLTLTSGNLTIPGGSTLTLGTTSANLVMSGGSSSSYIVAFDGGTVGSIQRYVNSNTSYFFPMGDATNYTPMTFTLNSNAGLSSAYVTTFTKAAEIPGFVAANFNSYLSRYWSVSQLGITTPNYDISYTYVDADLTGNEANLIPIKLSGGTWYKPSLNSSTGLAPNITNGTAEGTGSINTGSNTLTWAGLTTFSFDGAGGDEAEALPIDLLYFKVKPEGKKVRLDWATASEHNNDYFTVERSQTGAEFTKVFTQPGAGISTTTLYYFGYDKSPYSGVSYYRLKQTDFDGQSTYSNIESVNMKNEESPIEITIYPNPAVDKTIHISFNAESRQTYSIQIFDAVGKLIYVQEVAASKGMNEEVVSLPTVSEGLYQVEIGNENVGKIVKTVKF